MSNSPGTQNALEYAIMKCLNLIGQCEGSKSTCEESAIQRLLKYRRECRKCRCLLFMSVYYIDVCCRGVSTKWDSTVDATNRLMNRLCGGSAIQRLLKVTGTSS